MCTATSIRVEEGPCVRLSTGATFLHTFFAELLVCLLGFLTHAGHGGEGRWRSCDAALAGASLNAGKGWGGKETEREKAAVLRFAVREALPGQEVLI